MGNENENNMMETGFMYVDEFGQKTEVHKTYVSDAYDNGMDIFLLVESFKSFLLGAGFAPELVEMIKLEEKKE